MSFSTRVNATRLKSETICGKVDAWSPPWLEENRQLNPRSRALRRVAVGVSLRERKAPAERAKIHLFRERGRVGGRGRRSRSLKRHGERTGRRTERHRTAIALWARSPLSCRLTTAWFHAKRCFHGAVISFSQRTYDPLPPPPPRPLASLSTARPLSCHSLLSRARARGPFLLSSRLLALSEVCAKRAVSFTSFCPLPKYERVLSSRMYRFIPS